MGITKLITVIIFTAHCSGCIFFAIANSLHLHNRTENWADAAGLLRDCSRGFLLGVGEGGPVNGCDDATAWVDVGNQYMHSLYWATCVMFTVGYGDIVPLAKEERLYNILLFFVGTCIFAMVIVYVNDIVCQLDVTSDIYKVRLHRVKELLKKLDLGHDSWLRVLAYYHRLWAIQGGGTGEEIDFSFHNIYTKGQCCRYSLTV